MFALPDREILAVFVAALSTSCSRFSSALSLESGGKEERDERRKEK